MGPGDEIMEVNMIVTKRRPESRGEAFLRPGMNMSKARHLKPGKALPSAIRIRFEADAPGL